MIFSLNVKPTNELDGDLEYLSPSHRWVLSMAKAKKIYPFLSDEEIDERRNDISESVYYEAQYMLTSTANWPFAEWAIDCTDAGRNALKSCLIAQARSDATSGLESLARQSPIEKGQIIGKKALEANAVSHRVDGILISLTIEDSFCSYYPFRAVFAGVSMPSSRYGDLGY